jgi:hypothetical protein
MGIGVDAIGVGDVVPSVIRVGVVGKQLSFQLLNLDSFNVNQTQVSE